MKLLNLLTDELKRARIFYSLLVVSVILLEGSNISIKFWTFNRLIRYSDEAVLSLGDFFDYSSEYMMIVGGSAMALLIYAVFTWIRDWYFQGSFIYRLLNLPGNRAPIAFAKVGAILMLMAGLLVLQVALFYLTDWLASAFFASRYIANPVLVSLAQDFSFSNVLIPSHPLTALLTFGFGTSFLLILMNLCIIIFSFKGHGLLKTATIIIGYILLDLALMIALFLFIRNPLTTSEVMVFTVGFLVFYKGLQGGWMYWLMNHYISI